MEKGGQDMTRGDILQNNCLDFSKKVIIKKKSQENCSGLKETERRIAKCTMNTNRTLEQKIQLYETVLSQLSKFKYRLYMKYYWVNANILKSDNVIAVMEEKVQA